ncbi:DUF2933 domain-containing protein [Falsiroseomonas oryziterrae]|uniref:DUF2933 domain-containing protein n=1 Tax=Falsiroseomonas oryziterrae TaxID=2911368 RepID=UPI001F2ACBE0|nr:DUF2933 domain-containing protein [Roseomonas sp. NPKOSM-4]
MAPAPHATATTRPRWWRTPTGIAAVGIAAVVAFYVLREHWGHALGLLPYLLLLAGPLAHLLGHRGHGRHHGGTRGAGGGD